MKTFFTIAWSLVILNGKLPQADVTENLILLKHEHSVNAVASGDMKWL